MYTLGKEKYFQCSEWRKKLNNLYNINLELSEIHSIFESLNIPKKYIKIRGIDISHYPQSNVYTKIYDGSLRDKINMFKLQKTKPYDLYSKKTPSINIPLHDNVKTDDDYTYKNNENDMEKYSEYLINKVYENKINMPTHKVKGGYKWGKTGKVYPTKKQANKQGQAIYANGWKEIKENTIHITENELHEIIKESINRVINESRGIKSKKLYDIIKKHGGIKSTRGIFDLHNMLDSDIIDVVDWSDVKNYKPSNLDIADEVDYIELKDGKYLLAKCRGAKFDRISKSYNDKREKLDGDFEFLNTKKNERYKNRYPRKEDYIWQNKDAEFIFNNPYFRQNDGNWTPERKKEVMNNIRNKREWWNNEKE